MHNVGKKYGLLVSRYFLTVKNNISSHDEILKLETKDKKMIES